MNHVVLSLGSNIGDRFINLQSAVKQLNKRAGVIKQISQVYDNPPVGFDANINFLNICLELETKLDPISLLHLIQDIEKELGRVREGLGYKSRTIDIDIIFFNQLILNSENLSIPHPEFKNRKFVLTPLIDLDGGRLDPLTHQSVQQLLDVCIDKSPTSLYENQIFAYD